MTDDMTPEEVAQAWIDVGGLDKHLEGLDQLEADILHFITTHPGASEYDIGHNGFRTVTGGRIHDVVKMLHDSGRIFLTKRYHVDPWYETPVERELREGMESLEAEQFLSIPEVRASIQAHDPNLIIEVQVPVEAERGYEARQREKITGVFGRSNPD
jgi:hypothetical protein